jgi:hypothetical protein
MHAGIEYGEFCSMTCAAFRDDEHPTIDDAANFMQALRQVLVHRGRPEIKPQWPTDKKTKRGTTMPQDALDFFKVGTKYRSPMPLATSREREIASNFMDMSYRGSNMTRKRVIFIIDVSSEPQHVNFVEYNVPGEFEYLFMAYSCFKVTHVQTLTNPPCTEIHLYAFRDNMPDEKDPETCDSMIWPLATWH